MVDITEVVADLERNAINRDRIVLREQVAAIPYMEPLLGYRQQVLALLAPIPARPPEDVPFSDGLTGVAADVAASEARDTWRTKALGFPLVPRADVLTEWRAYD